MKKSFLRIVSVTGAILVCLCLWMTVAVSAAGNLSASASASKVTVGGSVTVTLQYSAGVPIGSVDAMVSYNTSAFQYVSCNGATANGGAGVVRLSWYASDVNAPTTVTVSLSFKALSAGDGGFSVSTTDFCGDDNSNLGSPSATVSVTASNPELSGNANLASLKPSSGTLTPAFKAGTTEYTVSVPYTTTSLSLSAAAAEKGAKVAVSGSNSLNVGKNTQKVTVTAPNGATKVYTVVITRSEGDGNTVSTEPPSEEKRQVTVNGVPMTVSDVQPETGLPEGYVWSHTDLEGTEVAAAVNENAKVTLLYLTDDATGTGAFFVYDASLVEPFFPFTGVVSAANGYVLLNLPDAMEPVAGTVRNTHVFGENTLSVLTYEDTALGDFVIVYAIAPNGDKGLYTYDIAENSLQRYHETVQIREVITTVNPLTELWQNYRLWICIGMGAFAVILTAVIVLIVCFRQRNRHCSH